MERIVFRNVSKEFSLSRGRKLLRGHLRELLRRKRPATFCALRNISLAVRDGEGLAVIGANGAGKSTLLNLATRLCFPDEGEVIVNGRLTAVLELGTGFHGDLTGAENVRLTASLFGLTRKRTRELFDEMVEFSGVSQFIDQPLRTYSSGMIMRLAFAVAIHADPDILAMDEVMAVGDQSFKEKCFERMMELRRLGKTMLCVSHSPDLLRHMCDRAIWLDQGEVLADGKLDEVIEAYQNHLAQSIDVQLSTGISR